MRAMRRLVEKALEQNPPPTLRALAVHLGYKDKKVLHAISTSYAFNCRRAARPSRRGTPPDSEENCNSTL